MTPEHRQIKVEAEQVYQTALVAHLHCRDLTISEISEMLRTSEMLCIRLQNAARCLRESSRDKVEAPHA